MFREELQDKCDEISLIQYLSNQTGPKIKGVL